MQCNDKRFFAEDDAYRLRRMACRAHLERIDNVHNLFRHWIRDLIHRTYPSELQRCRDSPQFDVIHNNGTARYIHHNMLNDLLAVSRADLTS